MGKTLATLIFLGAALTGGLAQAAEGDAARGAELATTCMGCHGIEGYRNAYPSFRVPRLGGQHAEYIVLALKGYRDQTRGHGTMHAQAATMSEQDMWDVAAFFASQGEIRQGPEVVTPGKEKATTCAACHGERGISITPMWPSLAGQHEDYLIHALRHYKTNVRKDPVMGGLAMPLSEEDIRDLAAYYAAQTGLFTTHYRSR